MTDLAPRPGVISERLLERARQVLPGGVTAAARIHAALGRPMLIARASGARIWDVDGTEYIDLNMSFGASLLGHGHPAVIEAIVHATELGIMCGYETEAQTRLAERLVSVIPSAELVRFAGSGTETTWHALRTARVATGRPLVVKFEGHFHGYNDSLGYSFWPSADAAGPVSRPRPVPESAGMPAGASVMVLPWNDADALRAVFDAHPTDIAAVVMEPVNHDSGTILPLPGYLETAREVTSRHGAVLIFDEVLCGFRTGVGGAQAQFGVTPDMTTLGKTLGGGTPLSAFVGSEDVMSAVAPLGRAVHSGTYNAHLVPVLAGLAFLDVATDPAFYPGLRARQAMFYPALRDAFARAGLDVRVLDCGARFSLLFGLDRDPVSYRDLLGHDTLTATRFSGAALDEGVYFHAAWHHGFSAMHSEADLESALTGIERAARRVASTRPAG